MEVYNDKLSTELPATDELELDISSENADDIKTIVADLPEIKVGEILSDDEWKETIQKLLDNYKSDKSLPEFKITLTTLILSCMSFILYAADYISDFYVAYDHFVNGKFEFHDIII